MSSQSPTGRLQQPSDGRESAHARDELVLSESVRAETSGGSAAEILHPVHFTNAPILVVDDQPDNILLIRTILRGGSFTNVVTTTDPRDVVTLLSAVQPHLLLLDLNMPYLDGFAVMEQVQRATPADVYLPILILTADPSPETKRRALSSGAADFLAKPFDTTEVRLRVTNLLRTRALYDTVRQQNSRLEQMVRDRTRALEESRLETLYSLALACEYRDDATGRHTERVADLSAAIGEEIGLSPEQIDLLKRAALLHDLGKIGIPDTILLKPGRLTADEFERMKAHTTIGFEILSRTRSTTLRLARDIALTHHERWDGHGYPRGVAGPEIPLAGRIVAVADEFDALIHERPYKPAWQVADALDEIDRKRGQQFDPGIVDALRKVVSEGIVLRDT